MASCNPSYENKQKIVDTLIDIVTKFSNDSDSKWSKITVCRRARELKEGEFVIPKGSAPKCVEVEDSLRTLLDFIHVHLSKSDNVDLPCERVDYDNYNIVKIHVNRPKSFANVISLVEENGDKYGYTTSNKDNILMMNAAHRRTDDIITPTDLRQLFIMEHVTELLKANGFQVHLMPLEEDAQVLKLCSRLCFPPFPTYKCVDEAHRQQILSRLEDSRYRETVTSSHADKSGNSVKHKPLVVNLRQFIGDVGASTGKMGYDKNMSKVEVFSGDEATDILDRVTQLYSHQMPAVSSHEQSSLCIIHLVPESRYFCQQQIDLVWRMLGGGEQCHLVLGSVTSRMGQACVTTAEDFIQLRYEQMKEASVMKYGEEVNGEAWEVTLSRMTSASIAFEMLNTACRNTVKLDLSNRDQMPSETRAGAFVMYSCARLATLFRHFQEAVGRGTYPPLPSMKDVQFETLKDEEEWELLFNYIYHYPDLVQQCVERVTPTPADIHARIYTHKISNFLVNFSRTLSSYYSRVHILGDCGKHLLPVMYARLHLMKAAHQVLKNGLALMGTQPLSQL